MSEHEKCCFWVHADWAWALFVSPILVGVKGMPVSLNGKQIIAMVLFVAMCSGLGAWVVSWAVVDSDVARIAVLQHQLEDMSASLVRVEAGFKDLRGEVRQAGLAIRAVGVATNVGGQSWNASNQSGAAGNEADVQKKDPEETGSDPTPDKVANLASEQEKAQVMAILDGLRTRDRIAYPDLPTLMSSPEMAVLSPTARNEVMTEVTKMLNSGELDMASFLHTRVPKL